MAGHVFITRGDLTHIICDAWLMPCGIDARPNNFWRTDIERLPSFQWPRPPSDWSFDGRRTFRIYPHRIRGDDGQYRPMPWMTNVGGGWSSGAEWFVDGVRQFLEAVRRDPDFGTSCYGRSKPLVALPIVGTGFGGMRHRAGEVVRALLPCLYEGAHEHDLDVVLVVRDEADYAAAQRERLSYHQDGFHRWPELSHELREQADRLARLASEGRLVLFMGSGVSTGAGIPTWGNFLRDLSTDMDMQLDVAWEDLQKWGYGDQARILERGFGSREEMGEAIARRLVRRNYTLTHSLLASMPVTESITTNYDTLYEQASGSIYQPVAALPYEPAGECDRWILKMHGCINHPEDIVVTREDYMRYQARRNALAGIVQALLITKHMLFVGFSLDDDNFHRIADEVRQVVTHHGGRPTEPFGSSIVLSAKPFLAQLWEHEIEMLVVDDGLDEQETSAVRIARGARMVEIFLDYLVAQVVDPKYLMDERFSHVLSPVEAELRDRLLFLVDELPPWAMDSPAWKRIEELLITLGWNGRFKM